MRGEEAVKLFVNNTTEETQSRRRPLDFSHSTRRVGWKEDDSIIASSTTESWKNEGGRRV